MDKSAIKFYTLVNGKDESVKLCNFGAAILEINVKDKNGNIDNVAVAYPKIEDYFCDGPYLNRIPGRYSNRICKGLFSLDGKEYKLSINNGENHLHGGTNEESYANRIWDSEQQGNKVVFSLFSPDGDAGYPGNVKIQAVYSFSDDSTLSLDITATTDAKTVINITHHLYVDLRGGKNKSSDGIRCHNLKLNCSRFLPTDSGLIPTGELAPVQGTPMDFTEFKALGKDLKADFPALNYGKGYDACWAADVVDGTVKPIAELCEPDFGRKMTVSTNRPAVQVYTGNWLGGSPSPKGSYNDYDGVAIECQDFPDGPNQPAFGYKPLEVGETYHNIITWKFEV